VRNKKQDQDQKHFIHRLTQMPQIKNQDQKQYKDKQNHRSGSPACGPAIIPLPINQNILPQKSTKLKINYFVQSKL